MINEKNSPVFKFQNGSISIAAFEGKYGRYFALQRSVYNSKTKEWKRENIFVSPSDFLNLGYVATQVLTWHINNPEIKEKQAASKQKQTESDEVPF